MLVGFRNLGGAAGGEEVIFRDGGFDIRGELLPVCTLWYSYGKIIVGMLPIQNEIWCDLLSWSKIFFIVCLLVKRFNDSFIRIVVNNFVKTFE